jgi:dihydrolipoamide dehydrogenase
METRTADVAIIGAGTAGLNARRQAEKEGARPILIESGAYGTMCARVGCMPSKLLIAAAEAAHGVAHAAIFGIDVGSGGWRVDGPAVLERVRRERDRFVAAVVEGVESIPQDQRVRGHARFVGPTTLQVDDHTEIEAKTVVVAAGSHPFVPPPFDAIRQRVMVNDDVFEMTGLPESMAVIGTGAIALELGQALHRLGVRVSFFNPFDELGPFTDPEMKRTVREVFAAELDLHIEAEVREAVPENGGVTLRWREADGTAGEDRFAEVLVAAGRRPNLQGLDLERTGLDLDKRGMPAWDPRTAQCGDSAIFMAGDVDATLPILHEASEDGRIAGSNAARFPDVVARTRRKPLTIGFTDPQIGMVGKTRSELSDSGFAMGEVSFDDQGRAKVIARNRGLVRIYAETDGCRLVGAEMLGPQVEHLAHLLAWAVERGMTVQEALTMPFYHPTLEEGLRTALRQLAGNLRVLGACRCEDMADCPGA